MFKIVIFTTLIALGFTRPSPNLGVHPLLASYGLGGSLSFHGYPGYPGYSGYYSQPGQGIFGQKEHVLQALHELLAKHHGLVPHGYYSGLGLKGYVGGYNGLNGGYGGFVPSMVPGAIYGSPTVPAAPSVKKVFNQVF